MPPLFWCERWDSNPHGETTRTSNVLVYHSNTLASDLSIITLLRVFVNPIFMVFGVVVFCFIM